MSNDPFCSVLRYPWQRSERRTQRNSSSDRHGCSLLPTRITTGGAILRRRVLGLARRAFYDIKTEDVKWKTVGFVFRWKYDSECHGKLIDVPASTTRALKNGSTRTDNQRHTEIVRQHYLTIACWIWRKPPVNALSRISVCGYIFRIEGFVADTPAGTKYPLNLDRDPHNFSLADALELQDHLARLLTIVRRCEKGGILATANSRELLEHGRARTERRLLAYVQCAHIGERYGQMRGAGRRIHRGTDGYARLMEHSS